MIGRTVAISPDIVENTGAEAYIGFRMGDRAVTARIPGRYRHAPGETVNLAVDTGRMCWFDRASGALSPALTAADRRFG